MPQQNGMNLDRGTLAIPAYSFANDPDTGIFSPAANQIALSAGGIQALKLTGDLTAGLIQPNGDGAIMQASVQWVAASVDNAFFIAPRNCRVLYIIATPEVVGSDGSAVTAVIKKAASGTLVSAGTALHTGSINLKGTAATNQALTLSATSSDLDIAAGTRIGIDFTGTLTAAVGAVTVGLAPV